MFVASTDTIVPPGTDQDPPLDLDATLAMDLTEAKRVLVEARLEQVRRDSPFNRAQVAAAVEKLDALLDLYLAVAR